MCRPPSAPTISLKAASTAAASATSNRLATAEPPAATTAATASPAATSLAVKLTTTLAPARPRATAMARPMPRDAPVTTAIFPVSSGMDPILPRICPERHNAVRIARRVHGQRRRDPTDEAGEHVPRAELDRARDAHRHQPLDRLFPAHGCGHLTREQLAHPNRILVGLRLDVGDDRHAGRRDVDAGELGGELLRRRLH